MPRQAKQAALGLLLTFLLAGPSYGQDYPEWFLQPEHKSPDKEFLYGYGAGRSVNQAREAAMADLAKFLSAEVKSSSKNTDSLKRGSSIQSSSSFRQTIEVRSKDIAFQGIENDQVSREGGKVYVRIKLATQNVFNQFNRSLSELNTKQQALSTSSKKIEGLTKIIELSPLLAQASQSASLLNSLEAADSLPANITLEAARQQWNQIQKNFDDQKRQGLYLVTGKSGDKMTSPTLVKEVLRLLNADKIRTTQNPASAIDGVFQVSFEGNQEEVMGAKKVQGVLTLKLSEGEVEYLSQNYTLAGFSASSFQQALEVAANSWGKNQLGLLASMNSAP